MPAKVTAKQQVVLDYLANARMGHATSGDLAYEAIMRDWGLDPIAAVKGLEKKGLVWSSYTALTRQTNWVIVDQPCVKCNGTGKITFASHREQGKMITTTCFHCHEGMVHRGKAQ